MQQTPALQLRKYGEQSDAFIDALHATPTVATIKPWTRFKKVSACIILSSAFVVINTILSIVELNYVLRSGIKDIVNGGFE